MSLLGSCSSFYLPTLCILWLVRNNQKGIGQGEEITINRMTANSTANDNMKKEYCMSTKHLLKNCQWHLKMCLTYPQLKISGSWIFIQPLRTLVRDGVFFDNFPTIITIMLVLSRVKTGGIEWYLSSLIASTIAAFFASTPGPAVKFCDITTF